MYSQRRKTLSQNFLHSRKLVKQLVRQSSIVSQDIVLEIGPGKGIITEELLTTAMRVTAVEVDTVLCDYLHNKFQTFRNFQLINKDFLRYKLPTYPYKVFANIPFSIEGKIIRKLLNAPNSPKDCYLVMREDLAKRLIGHKKESQFSIFYKPWFTFEIVHYFKKTDFTPFATMNTVLLRFTKRKNPLLEDQDRKRYILFVGQGFGGGKRLKFNLRSYFIHEQFQRLATIYNFKYDSKPTDLRLEQWIGIFNYVKSIGRIEL